MIANHDHVATSAYISHFILSARELNNSEYTAVNRWVDSSGDRWSFTSCGMFGCVTVELEGVLHQGYGRLLQEWCRCDGVGHVTR